MSTPRVAVVGGGISGLAAAHRLRTLLGPAAEIVVLEQRGRPGGVLRTVDLAGAPYDVGAEAFLWRRPEVRDLLDELGLAGEVVHPAGAAPSVRAGGVTVPLPPGTLLGVPTSAARLDGVLSPAGAAAAAAERDRALHWTGGGDVALGALLRDRFGDELADRLADPLLGGVYAGRVDALGLRATLPAVAAALDAGAPSLTAAADRAIAAARQWVGCPRPARPAREPAAPSPVFGALRGGYATLVDALTAGVDVRLSTTVRGLHRRTDGWLLVLGPGQDDLVADAVVLAVPGAGGRPAARRRRPGGRPRGGGDRAGLVRRRRAGVPGDGRGEPAGHVRGAGRGGRTRVDQGRDALGTQVGPPGGGSDRRPRAATDIAGPVRRGGDAAGRRRRAVARSRADLATLAGITAAPVAVHVQRWGGGLPQYAVGHVDRVRAIEEAVAGVPGLAVAGAALHGVGVPACVGTARAAAERLAKQLTPAAR